MDIILSGGVIVDGTGRPGFQGDVRVSGDSIAWVGEGSREGAETVDVSGHVVCPGFVDFHAHTDMTALVNPTVESKLAQGVTLEVNGNCGFSDAPILNEEARERARRAFERLGSELSWSHFGEMLDVLERSGVAVNVCSLVGHANVRREVVGSEDRPATPDELKRMSGLVSRAMDEGAVGLSSGLIYPPSCYGSTEELACLSRIVARRGGLYATHMRSESDNLLDSVREAIAVGEQSGAPVQISHLKACGRSNHGKAVRALEMIHEARERGLDITADQYPYTATCTGLDTLIPSWAHSGGPTAMHERLADTSVRARIRDEISQSLEGGYWRDSGGLESIVISSVTEERNRWAEGLTAAEVASRIGGDPVDALLDLLVDEDFGVGMVHFSLSETDVEAVMRTSWTLFGSDATARACSGPMGRGKPHPRAFGTFPRVLAHYVRERRILSLEEAIRKMTSLATERLGIRDRGRVAPGMKADIVVFHPQNVRDTATFADPQRLPEGILHVLVNGRFALRDGKITGETPGRVLRGAA
ncbi:MAG: aminoacylase [Armatimonadota bacterium]|nr:MAG: aminoacylase [Armatimonadota bacterium]